MDEEGVPLPGGNTAPVVREGDTVRRVAGPWTAQVHALMHGLRAAGCDVVPEPRGFDPHGREVVEYVAGDCPIYPMPPWVWDDDILVQVARALRRIHDASATLSLPPDGWRYDRIEPAEVVCHSDIAPYNCVFRHGRLVAFIDWDYAVPAPRGWDLGYAAYRFVSLTPPGHPDGRHADAAEQRRRVGVLCSAYGDEDPIGVVGWALVRVQGLIGGLHSPVYERDTAWIERLLA